MRHVSPQQLGFSLTDLHTTRATGQALPVPTPGKRPLGFPGEHCSCACNRGGTGEPEKNLHSGLHCREPRISLSFNKDFTREQDGTIRSERGDYSVPRMTRIRANLSLVM